MKQKILIIRSQDIFTDSRVLRYEEWFKKNNIEYKILAWNRSGEEINRENTDYCNIKARFNMGKKGIVFRFKWSLFITKYLLKNKKKFDVIHACDLDTIWPALLMKGFRKKVIFDIFDWFSDEVKTGNVFIDKCMNIMEKIATKLSDLTIICEDHRLKQMNVLPKKHMIIPNIPDFSKCGKNKEVDKTKNKSISIAYVGGFYEDRGLIELVETIKLFKNYELHIAGFGDYKIERFISDAANKTKNIYYYGRVSYNQALEIMQKADLLYAMYYKFNRNNIFAAPNKFYESIFLQKPIITTAGTLVAKKVLSHNSGYVIEEGNRALKDLLLSINKLDLISLKENLNKYKTKYTQTFNHCMIRYLRNIKDMYRRQ